MFFKTLRLKHLQFGSCPFDTVWGETGELTGFELRVPGLNMQRARNEGDLMDI